MSSDRPALTVDVNMGGPGGRNIASKAAAQARASAQAPSVQYSKNENGVQPGDIISEEDLMAQQGGFSSDEDVQDNYQANGSKGRGTRLINQNQNQEEGQEQSYDSQVSFTYIPLPFVLSSLFVT